jgi:hypothetical protein
MVFVSVGTTFGPDLSDGILVALAGLFGMIGVLIYRASMEVKAASGVLALTGIILLMVADVGTLPTGAIGFDLFSHMSTGVFYAAFMIAIPTAVAFTRTEGVRRQSFRVLAGITFGVAGIGGLVEGVQWLDSSPWSSINAVSETTVQVASWFSFAGGIAWFVASIVTLVVSLLLVIDTLPSLLEAARAQAGTQPSRQPAGGDGGGAATQAGSTPGQAAGSSEATQAQGGAQTVQQSSDGDTQRGTFCSSCGAEVDPDDSFCSGCGSEIQA